MNFSFKGKDYWNVEPNLRSICSESQKTNAVKKDLGIDGMDEETWVAQEQDGISRTMCRWYSDMPKGLLLEGVDVDRKTT
jgi:hypothetical protein